MIISVASFKGGVGKTTTAVHLAAYMQTLAPTLLLDADSKTKSATVWSKAGKGFPFRVASIGQAVKLAADYGPSKGHIVIDSGQAPSLDDLRAAIDDSDLLVIPAVPPRLDVEGLVTTLQALKEIGATGFKVLITKVAPNHAAKAKELRGLLVEMEIGCFTPEIPRLTAFEKASDDGSIVNQVDDRNAARAWEAYAAAGREIAQ